MRSRGRRLGFAATVLAVALLLAAAVATGARAPSHPVKIEAPSGGGAIVAYGRSQVLLLNGGFGESSGSITRLNLDGSVDRSFGDEGTVAIYAQDAVVTADGKILVATSSRPEGGLGIRSEARVTCLLPDGRPDRSFGDGGNADIRFGRHADYGEVLALAANGDILLGGLRVDSADSYGSIADLAVARLKPDGTADRSFGRAGVRAIRVGGEIEAMGIGPTPSEGVVLEGGTPGEAFLAKLDRDGSIDRHFGERGYAPIENKGGRPESLFLTPGLITLPGGKLLVGANGPGRSGSKGVVVRLRADGRVDHSYGDGGWAYLPAGAHSSVRGMALLPGGTLALGTIFHGGSSTGNDFGAVVFGHDGHLDRRFAARGSCRAPLAGDQETVDLAAVGGRPVALSSRFDGPWLLACPPLP
jgi:uncharacterized delta-60 repeat protein